MDWWPLLSWACFVRPTPLHGFSVYERIMILCSESVISNISLGCTLHISKNNLEHVTRWCLWGTHLVLTLFIRRCSWIMRRTVISESSNLLVSSLIFKRLSWSTSCSTRVTLVVSRLPLVDQHVTHPQGFLGPNGTILPIPSQLKMKGGGASRYTASKRCLIPLGATPSLIWNLSLFDIHVKHCL